MMKSNMCKILSRKETCKVLHTNEFHHPSWNSFLRGLPQPAGKIISRRAENVARI